jgi:hypothetical protein
MREPDVFEKVEAGPASVSRKGENAPMKLWSLASSTGTESSRTNNRHEVRETDPTLSKAKAPHEWLNRPGLGGGPRV